MKRLFILIAALILAVNSAYALPRNVALRNAGNQAGYERLVRGLEPTLWLATDEGITVSGSNVTQWDSLVGSISFTQSTVANQPVLTYSAATGHKGVVFDGSDDVMTSASTVDDIIDNDAAETFIVFQSYGSTGASQYLLNGTNREYQFQIFSGDLYYVNDDGGTDQIQDTSFEFATDYVMAGRHADGRIYMSLNGVEATDVASGDTIGMTETLFLGDRSGSSGEFNGPFYEIITFDKVLSDNQRQAIIEGLESKYRID